MNVNENALIQVQDLKKSFGTQVVLDGITTEIDQGEVVAIIGPSGCGKSTFLRSLNLLEEPTSGTILFEGTDITGKSVDINKMRQKIGMVFQQFNLFPNYTIQNNITLAPVKLGLMTQQEAEKKAKELLERVGLPERANDYPSQLSGGQKQRIAIARALAMNPGSILNGTRITNVVPTSFSLSKVMVPPIFSTSFLEMAIPSPVPANFVRLPVCSCANGSKIYFWNSSVIPIPVSRQTNSIVAISDCSDGISIQLI